MSVVIHPMPVEATALAGGGADDELILSAGPSFGAIGIRVVWLTGACEDGEQCGLTWMAMEMLERGTRKRSREEMYASLERHGVSVSLRVHRTVTTLDVRMLESRVGQGLELVAEMLNEAADLPVELRRLREETASTVSMSLEEPGGLTQRLLSPTLWPLAQTTWGLPVDGTRATRKSMTPAQFEEARLRVFGGRALVGIWADQPEHWAGAVQQWFAMLRQRWPRHGRVRPERPTPAWGHLSALPFQGSSQASVIVVGSAPSTQSDNWSAVCLHAAAFGSGFRSPLVKRIRSEEGLSYEVGAGLSPDASESMWTMSTAPEASKVAHVIDTTRQCWEAFHSSPPDEKWVEDTKSHVLGQHLVALETVRQRLSGAIQLRTLDVPVSDLWDHPARIQAITRDEMLLAGRNYAWGAGRVTVVAALSGGLRSAQWKQLNESLVALPIRLTGLH
jgi:zinc protease